MAIQGARPASSASYAGGARHTARSHPCRPARSPPARRSVPRRRPTRATLLRSMTRKPMPASSPSSHRRSPRSEHRRAAPLDFRPDERYPRTRWRTPSFNRTWDASHTPQGTPPFSSCNTQLSVIPPGGPDGLTLSATRLGVSPRPPDAIAAPSTMPKMRARIPGGRESQAPSTWVRSRQIGEEGGTGRLVQELVQALVAADVSD